MPKKTKLKLENLKIKSFVTSLEADKLNEVKGGHTCETECGGCPTDAGSDCPSWGPCETLKTECTCPTVCSCAESCTCPESEFWCTV